MAETFIITKVVRELEFGHCSAGISTSKGLNKPIAPSPEPLAEPVAAVI